MTAVQFDSYKNCPRLRPQQQVSHTNNLEKQLLSRLKALEHRKAEILKEIISENGMAGQSELSQELTDQVAGGNYHFV